MLEKFYGWVKAIAACLIFLSLIIRLLPEGKNIKYIRYFMGMVLVLVVLAPAGRLFGLEKVFSQLEISFEREGARADFEGELALMGEVYAEEVVRGYEEELAAEVLAPAGRIVLCGFFGTKQAPCSWDFISTNDAEIIGSLGSPGIWDFVISLMESGRLDVKGIISHELPLKSKDDFMNAFGIMTERRENVCKVVLKL